MSEQRRKNTTRARMAATGENYTTARRAVTDGQRTGALPKWTRTFLIDSLGIVPPVEQWALITHDGTVLQVQDTQPLSEKRFHLTGFAVADAQNIIIGRRGNNEEMVVNLQTDPHWMFTGQPGSGKTRALNGLHQALVEAPDLFDVITIDPRGNLPGSERFTGSRFDSLSQFMVALDPVIDRSHVVPEHAGKHLMVLMDNVDGIRPPVGCDEEGTEEKAELHRALDRLAQLGRSQCIHLVLASHYVRERNIVDTFRGLMTQIGISDERGVAHFG